MERRVYATGKKHWQNINLIVTSPSLTFEEYISDNIKRDTVVNIMAGDLQRIKLYAGKGFQIPQAIPADVWSAYEELVKLGYTKHLAKE
jgi:hypothetical protein